MTHSFDISFAPRAEREALTRRVDIVLTPVDDFTGEVVAAGVTAEIALLGARGRRSLTGHLAFERLLERPSHAVRIDPSRAGYFAPPPLVVVMPQDRGATRILRLVQRPDAVVGGSAMIVRGSVERDRLPVPGLTVEGRIEGVVFRTLTDERGNFALRLRPPAVDLGADPVPVPVTADAAIRFVGTGLPDRLLPGLEDLRTTLLPKEVIP